MVKVMKKVSVNYVKNAKVARNEWPGALVLDVTRDGMMGNLDPSFPLKMIGVPGMEKKMGLSVMGICEGLKIFKKKKEVNENWMNDEKKLGMKRSCKSYGELEGWMIGEKVVNVEEGIEVFENLYKKIIEERFSKVIEGLKREQEKREIVLLDYMNDDDKGMIDHVRILKELIES